MSVLLPFALPLLLDTPHSGCHLTFCLYVWYIWYISHSLLEFWRRKNMVFSSIVNLICVVFDISHISSYIPDIFLICVIDIFPSYLSFSTFPFRMSKKYASLWSITSFLIHCQSVLFDVNIPVSLPTKSQLGGCPGTSSTLFSSSRGCRRLWYLVFWGGVC